MKKAFTLAEAMMSIAIIGVIAVLVIPSVSKNIFDKTKISAFQTTFNDIGHAVKADMFNNRTAKFSYDKDTFWNDDWNGQEVSYSREYSNLSGSAVTLPTVESDCYKLSKGAVVCISQEPDDDKYSVFVDVNAQDNPNVIGRDAFAFYIYDDGFVGDREDENPSKENCQQSTDGTGCLNYLIDNDWTVDY